MSATKKICSGEMKPGMKLIEKDGTVREIIQVVHKTDCTHVLFADRRDARLSLIRLYTIECPHDGRAWIMDTDGAVTCSDCR